MLDRHQSRGIAAGMSEWKIPAPPRLAPTAQVVSAGQPCAMLDEIQAKQIAMKVQAGFSVERICLECGIDVVTFYELCESDADFSKLVAKARVSAAHAFADRAVAVAEDAMADPGERGERAQAARVAAGVFQWQAERRLPAIYGQRSALAIDARITVAGETPLSMASFVAARAKVALPVAVAGQAAVEIAGAPVSAPVPVMPAAAVTPALVIAPPAPAKWVSRGGPAVNAAK